ncbi:MAG: hypothetical protein LUE93_04760 [Bacteroides sp.]|nr:hypothetical protein [Bacteroides sp.]
MQYSKTRHKAETKTDKNGKYRVHFLIKDDEQQTERDKEASISKSYSLIFDLKNLNPEKYIVPDDMIVATLSVDPPITELAGEGKTTIRYGYSFERGKSYTENLYIPQKKYIQVTLKGFVSQYSGNYYDSFGIDIAFPYGGEGATDHSFPGTKYGYERINDLFILYDQEERTFQIPFALNENNIITLTRRKDGVRSTEEYQLFVTEETPVNLVYEY